MKTRALPAVLAALTLGLLLAGGQALASQAVLAAQAPPPTLEVSVIGHGVVTGAGGAIDCGDSALSCATAFGSTGASPTLTESADKGWSFDHWEVSSGGPCNGSASASCTLGTPNMLTGDNGVFAVFKSGGAVSSTTLTTTLNNTAAGQVLNDSANYPTNCGTPHGGGAAQTACSLQVVGGSTITLRERPNAGFFFKSWGGACAGSNFACSVYMSSDQSVSADFVAAGTNPLTVNVNGSGTVSGGVSCASGGTCTVAEPSNSTVVLKATPNDGYAFTGWDDDCQGPQTTCSIDMSAARTVTANFAPIVPVLITVSGSGTVTGAGVTCLGPATCSGSAAPGSTIQLQATPATTGGSVSWLGCTSASGTICNVVVGSIPVSITANFSGGTTGGGGGSLVSLTVSVTGNGYVTATSGQSIWCTAAGGSGCATNVQQNSFVTLHAVPASGLFNNWGGACAGNATTCTVTMSGAKTVTAQFTGSQETHNLTVSISGSGSVTGAGLNCTQTGTLGCTSPQPDSATVAITAVAAPGSTFVAWSGDCTGSANTCNVAMDSDQSVTATFRSTAPQTVRLAITINGAGTVTAGAGSCVAKPAKKPTTCTETINSGSAVAPKATPAKGYVFAGWKGACTGTKACTLVLNADAALTATFVRALAAGAKKPTVAHISSGYRITISFRAGEAGKLTVTTRPKTATVKKTVKAGAGTARITVKKHGRYVITLSLRSKSGTHTLRYTVRV
jgi:uncharacterized repeat protein (TIGR02543 family)